MQTGFMGLVALGKITIAVLTYSIMVILLVFGTLLALVFLLIGSLPAVANNIDPPLRPWSKTGREDRALDSSHRPTSRR